MVKYDTRNRYIACYQCNAYRRSNYKCHGPVNPAALFTHCCLILLKRGYYADFYITLLGRRRNRR